MSDLENRALSHFEAEVTTPPQTCFSNTVFFVQWSASLDDIMLDMHDVIITGDLNFHLDIPKQLDVRRFPERDTFLMWSLLETILT